MKGNVLISQLMIPFYRVDFFNKLLIKLNDSIIISGINDGSTTTTPSHYLLDKKIIETSNIFYFNNSFWRQKNLFKYSRQFKIIVILFSLRNLDMYWLLLLKILGIKKVYFWGHIRGKNRIAFIRLFFASLATNFLFYTKSESNYASQTLFFNRKKLFFLGNSCVSSNYCLSRLNETKSYCWNKRKGLIYSGRLIIEKGIYEAVYIFLESCLIKKNGFDNLYIVGSGPEESRISSIIKSHPCGSRVKLLGEVMDDESLVSWYNKCSASISHGYVGLNSIQSFSNGVPMFVLNGPFHSPEIESCDTNLNTVFYNDEVELRLLFEIWNSDLKFNYSPLNIINNIYKNYTFERMRNNFIRALNQ